MISILPQAISVSLADTEGVLYALAMQPSLAVIYGVVIFENGTIRRVPLEQIKVRQAENLVKVLKEMTDRAPEILSAILGAK